MSDDEQRNEWQEFLDVVEKAEESATEGLEGSEYLDFDCDGKKFRIVTRKEYSDRESQLKSLLPTSLVREQLLGDQELGKYFSKIRKSCTVRNSGKDMASLLDIFTRTLNNVHQIREFSEDHKQTAEVASLFERGDLPRYANEWKVKLFERVSMRDGRIEIHINDISSAVQIIINEANRNYQKKSEEAAAIYKNALAKLTTERDATINGLGPMKSLAQLSGAFINQDGSIKDAAARAYLHLGLDPEEMPYLSWANEWWATKKNSYIVDALSSLSQENVFQDFFKARWFRE